MKIYRFVVLALLLPLAACGPKIEVSTDRVAGRLITVTNRDTVSFTLKRIVANSSPENPLCNDYPNQKLAPDESWSGTITLCGTITELRVETDRGTVSVEWK